MTQPTLYRVGLTELERTDPHTLTGRAVPYDVPADVTDLGPDGLVSYREGFRSGAFDHQFAAPQRVRLVDGHKPDGTPARTSLSPPGSGTRTVASWSTSASSTTTPPKSKRCSRLVSPTCRSVSRLRGWGQSRPTVSNGAPRPCYGMCRSRRSAPIPAPKSSPSAADPEAVLEEADAEYQRQVAELDEYLELEKARQAEMAADYAARGLIAPAE